MATVKIPLRNKGGEVVAHALIDAADELWVNRNRWYLRTDNGYVVRNSSKANGRKHHPIYLHREVMRRHGRLPAACECDHISRDKLDNRSSNLRAVSPTHNQANQAVPKNSRTGFKGVTRRTRSSGRVVWEAHIGLSGKYKYIGSYSTVEDAAHAYDHVARQLYGEFARYNFPRSGERSCR